MTIFKINCSKISTILLVVILVLIIICLLIKPYVESFQIFSQDLRLEKNVDGGLEALRKHVADSMVTTSTQN
jgi:hypothetical protein